ncbi:hypothetical protein GUJ93_ZPchr0008g12830 [Zizania palustris]|uniref:Uncharacterized protein n=1 Tax=Zizania palustris TaxID=103762 RepID=A0A8J5R072_ZIZPA|nr:hypothetical protein GUJ93_ZPchr0008g12830 [Zizania palustris]
MVSKWDGAAEFSEKDIIRTERNSGVISNMVTEIQTTEEDEAKDAESAEIRWSLHGAKTVQVSGTTLEMMP